MSTSPEPPVPHPRPASLDHRLAPRIRVPQRGVVAAALLALGACGGGEATPPEPPPVGAASRVDVLAGAGSADTIQAAIAPLRLVVRGTDGRPVPGVDVAFLQVRDPRWTPIPDWDRGDVPFLEFRLGDATAYVREGRTTTDGAGGVTAHLRLGSVAGPAALQVSIARSATGDTLRDTVRFDVRPGRAVALTFVTSADTTVMLGGTAQLRASTVDRANNFRPDTVSYAVDDTAPPGRLRVEPRGLVTGLWPARVPVSVSYPGLAPVPGWVTVVPRGTLALRVDGPEGPGIYTMALDGSARRRLNLSVADTEGTGTWENQAPLWSPDGQWVLVAAQGGVLRLGLDGRRETLIARDSHAASFASAVLRVHSFAPPAADGTVFYALDCGGGTAVFRRTVTGAEQRVRTMERTDAEDSGTTCGTYRYESPAISPDGRHLALVERGATGDQLLLTDLASGAVQATGVSGAVPRWSPGGDRLLYVVAGTLWTMRPDGTGRQQIPTASTTYYAAEASWSPDGRYVVALRGSMTSVGGARLMVIDVESGAELVLPYSVEQFVAYTHRSPPTFYAPAWRPE
jgi:Tol biopolymer transport system component